MTPTWTLVRVRVPYPSESDVLVVAVLADDTAVGAVHAEDDGTLRHIFVDPSARGRGLAHLLLDAVRGGCDQVRHDNQLSPAGAAMVAREAIDVMPELAGCPDRIDPQTAEATGRTLLRWAAGLFARTAT